MNFTPWYKQVAYILVPFLVVSAAFPVLCWFVLIAIFHGIESVTGYHAPLVSNPGGVDLGAVLVTLIYGVVSLLLVFNQNKNRCLVAAYGVGISSLILLFYVFTVVSSVIWF